MLKNISLAMLLLSSIAFNVNADDTGRLDQLKKEVQELERRILKLESLHGDQGEGQKVVDNGEGWKSTENWRKLSTGMDYDEVERILGKPHRVDGGELASWRYPERGTVRFYRGKVDAWSEPRL